MENFAWLIPALPLFGFLFSIFLGNKLPKTVVASVASLAVLIPFIFTVSIFIPFISSVDADFNITFAKIPAGGNQLSIRLQQTYPLQFKMVKNDTPFTSA